MGTADWPLLTDPWTPSIPVSAPADPGIAQATSLSFTGRGILRPFTRDQKVDFANASGARLVAACVGQVLGTSSDSEFASGELPWRTAFGSKLYLLRQRLNSQALVEQARRFVADALRRWEPRIRINAVSLFRTSAPTGGKLNVLGIRVKYELVDENSGDNTVLAGDLETVVNLGGTS